MEKWLAAALDYLPRWLEHQMRLTEQPGCAVALAHRGKPLLHQAFGHADLPAGQALTTKHVFRVASHSKLFTAVAVMKLREAGKLSLDDPVGRHVEGLHPQVAETTLALLLSHSAGLVRDGADAGQWLERRPFHDEAALRADLQAGLTLDANSRFKYSNHGYGLLGLAIESITGEAFGDWVAREVVAASGLQNTWPDAPAHAARSAATQPAPLTSGHSSKLPLGRRVAIPAAMSTRALAAATGFVSNAEDLVRFVGSLSPQAKRSVLSVASRRELMLRRWRDPHATLERWYGLGVMSGPHNGLHGAWDWFGHTGGFPGTLTRTACVPAQELTVSVLTNAADGLCYPWTDGVLHILQAFAKFGAPSRRTAGWTGRWWTLWGSSDLLPVADRVLVANPALTTPLQDASQITPGRSRRDGTLTGQITLANGFASHGEPAALEHDAAGRPAVLQLGGTRLKPERETVRELTRRYGAK